MLPYLIHTKLHCCPNKISKFKLNILLSDEAFVGHNYFVLRFDYTMKISFVPKKFCVYIWFNKNFVGATIFLWDNIFSSVIQITGI